MDIGREAVRSAVVLAKFRYDEQLHPFVRTSKERLESDLVQEQLSRIVVECSAEVDADPEKVQLRLNQILADVVLPVTQPEHQDVTDVGNEPPKNNSDDVEPQATTDVYDHEPVLVDEILNPGKIIPVQGKCVRCEKNAAADNGVCPPCEFALVETAFQKEAIGPQLNTPGVYQPGLAPSNPAAAPLNPNAPYQCTVCGFTGNFQDVQNHLATSNDTNHMRAKQQQQQTQQTPQTQPTQQYQQQPTAKLQWKLASPDDESADTTPAYETDVHQDEVRDTNESLNPVGHFSDVVSQMANHAAARHFSSPTDDKVQAIADAYGLDPEEVRKNLYVTAKFGDYSATNGEIGEAKEAPQGYVPLDLQGLGGDMESHEAVVPTNTALAKTAEDLGLDSNDVYDSIRDRFGDDLSDEYHTSVKGEFHYFLAQSVLDQATKNPQPVTPDDTQGQQAPQQQPPPQMQPAPPSGPSPMPQFASAFKLNQQQLEVLLNRDGSLAMQRVR